VNDGVPEIRGAFFLFAPGPCALGDAGSLRKEKAAGAPRQEELQQVPGIGPSTAQKILQARKSYGAFKSVDDLQAIQGIGPKRLEKMRKYLTVGKAAPSNKVQKSTVTKCSCSELR
jgi:competence ComEA-like helix-hairpin-helix protein